MSEKLRIIKETMEFLNLDKKINLELLFLDAENNSDVDKLVSLWYNVKNDPGLSKMLLKEIMISYEMAEKN